MFPGKPTQSHDSLLQKDELQTYLNNRKHLDFALKLALGSEAYLHDVSSINQGSNMSFDSIDNQLSPIKSLDGSIGRKLHKNKPPQNLEKQNQAKLPHFRSQQKVVKINTPEDQIRNLKQKLQSVQVWMEFINDRCKMANDIAGSRLTQKTPKGQKILSKQGVNEFFRQIVFRLQKLQIIEKQEYNAKLLICQLTEATLRQTELQQKVKVLRKEVDQKKSVIHDQELIILRLLNKKKYEREPLTDTIKKQPGSKISPSASDSILKYSLSDCQELNTISKNARFFEIGEIVEKKDEAEANPSNQDKSSLPQQPSRMKKHLDYQFCESPIKMKENSKFVYETINDESIEQHTVARYEVQTPTVKDIKRGTDKKCRQTQKSQKDNEKQKSQDQSLLLSYLSGSVKKGLGHSRKPTIEEVREENDNCHNLLFNHSGFQERSNQEYDFGDKSVRMERASPNSKRASQITGDKISDSAILEIRDEVQRLINENDQLREKIVTLENELCSYQQKSCQFENKKEEAPIKFDQEAQTLKVQTNDQMRQTDKIEVVHRIQQTDKVEVTNTMEQTDRIEVVSRMEQTESAQKIDKMEQTQQAQKFDKMGQTEEIYQNQRQCKFEDENEPQINVVQKSVHMAQGANQVPLVFSQNTQGNKMQIVNRIELINRIEQVNQIEEVQQVKKVKKVTKIREEESVESIESIKSIKIKSVSEIIEIDDEKIEKNQNIPKNSKKDQLLLKIHKATLIDQEMQTEVFDSSFEVKKIVQKISHQTVLKQILCSHCQKSLNQIQTTVQSFKPVTQNIKESQKIIKTHYETIKTHENFVSSQESFIPSQQNFVQSQQNFQTHMQNSKILKKPQNVQTVSQIKLSQELILHNNSNQDSDLLSSDSTSFNPRKQVLNFEIASKIEEKTQFSSKIIDTTLQNKPEIANKNVQSKKTLENKEFSCPDFCTELQKPKNSIKLQKLIELQSIGIQTDEMILQNDLNYQIFGANNSIKATKEQFDFKFGENEALQTLDLSKERLKDLKNYQLSDCGQIEILSESNLLEDSPFKPNEPQKQVFANTWSNQNSQNPFKNPQPNEKRYSTQSSPELKQTFLLLVESNKNLLQKLKRKRNELKQIKEIIRKAKKINEEDMQKLETAIMSRQARRSREICELKQMEFKWNKDFREARSQKTKRTQIMNEQLELKVNPKIFKFYVPKTKKSNA